MCVCVRVCLPALKYSSQRNTVMALRGTNMWGIKCKKGTCLSPQECNQDDYFLNVRQSWPPTFCSYFVLHPRTQCSQSGLMDKQYENCLLQATQPQRDSSQCHSLSEVGTSAVFSLCQHLFHPLRSLSFLLSSLRTLRNYISGSIFLSEFKATLE